MATKLEEKTSRVVRFAGDSGDGIQLVGEWFTQTSGAKGHGVATLPDFPAEIRAPVGTLFGVSAFQAHFGARKIKTTGDVPDVLVALNPAALKVNLGQVPQGKILIIDESTFTDRLLKKAGFGGNPLLDDSLRDYTVWSFDITAQTLAAVQHLDLGNKQAQRCKNMWVLGLVYWLFDLPIEPTLSWLEEKFAKKQLVQDGNIAALKAGHSFAETMELPQGIEVTSIAKDDQREKGAYRVLTGTQTLYYGLMAGSVKADIPLMYCSYPITPASPLLHLMATGEELGVRVFQAEDEIGAVGAAIGASYGGELGVTGSSGPGVALMSEALSFAVAVELPLVIVNAQRGGPSTGLPTKTEQSDLFQALCGRHGDAPLIVMAPATPADCFSIGFEAVKVALMFMTPVIVLTDGFLSNSSEPWKIETLADLPPIASTLSKKGHNLQLTSDEQAIKSGEKQAYFPYAREKQTLARRWVVPGAEGLSHRLGGIERDQLTGHISYDPDNHHAMTKMRAAKIQKLLDIVPEPTIDQGETEGDLLLITWGSTYGAASRAVERIREEGCKVSHYHFRYLSPFDPRVKKVFSGFRRLLVAELNNGQLSTFLQGLLENNVAISTYHKIAGKPFTTAELFTALQEEMEKYRYANAD